MCICRRTLAWISSEISTKLTGMLTHLDWSSLAAAGLSHADRSLLLSSVEWLLASPFANCLPLSFFVSLLSRSLTHFRSRRDRGLRPLFGFVPKLTKGSSAWQTTYIVLLIFNAPVSFHRISATNYTLILSFSKFVQRSLLMIYFLSLVYCISVHLVTLCRWSASWYHCYFRVPHFLFFTKIQVFIFLFAFCQFLLSAGTTNSTIRQVFFSFDYHLVWQSGRDLGIRLYLNIHEKFVGLIL